MAGNGAATSVAEKRSNINTTKVVSPKGYKHTKVGMIPEEWEVVRLEEYIVELEAGVSVNSTDSICQNENDKGILKTSSISNGKFVPTEHKKIIQQDMNRAKVNPKQGNLIISRMNTPELVGAIAIIEDDFNNLYLPDRLWQTKFSKTKKLNPFWLNYLLNTYKYKLKVKSLGTGTSGSMKNISKKSFLKIQIPIPPLKEQQKIAQILTTWDRAIEKLEALIAAKEELKKGLMQKLLSGEVRFWADHTGAATSVAEDNATEVASPEWEEVRLGDIATFYKGKGISKNDISDKGIECIRYGELYTKYGEKIEKVFSKTSIDRNNLFLSEKNDILIPASGETAIDIATASCVLKDDIALSGDINVIRTNEDGVFLSYYLNVTAKTKIASLAQGVSVIHLYQSQLQALKIKLPPKQEQQKIAQVLTTADKEIELLKEEFETLKEQKRGVMQRLLTGEVRVVA